MERSAFLKALVALPASGAISALAGESEKVTFDKKLVGKLVICDRQFTMIVTDEEAAWLNKHFDDDYRAAGGE